jgi:hypothetical protein
MRRATLVLLGVGLLGGCRGDDGHTELRPNAAGRVLAIGSACKPEDGWQYMFPPGWPADPIAEDGGVRTSVPLPSDYKETFQLDPGIGYCVVDPQTAPDGFFTSNCHQDRDCPAGARCDEANRCNLACARDSDCHPGLYCPETPGGARFCQQGCPVSAPAPHDGCYEYRGPRPCYYPATGGPGDVRTICRCASKPQNSAEWECVPEDSCPPSPAGESPCRPPASGEVTCRYDQFEETCRCQAGKFACTTSSPVGPVDASATSEAGSQ